MFRRTLITFLLLVSVFLLPSQAQQPTPVQRLGITGTTVQLKVWSVVKDSAAEKSGLQVDDQLVIFDAQPLTSGMELLRAVGSATPGQHQLTILRNGKVQQISIDLGPVGGGRLGVAFVSGVRVDVIERGSPASGFGLQHNDLITSIKMNDRTLPTPTVEDLVRYIAAVPASSPFGIVYARGASSLMLTAQLASAPTADASVSGQAQAQPAFSRGGQTAGRGEAQSSTVRPEPKSGGRFAGGERQGDYVTPPRDQQIAPPSGGRGAPRDTAVLGQAVQDARSTRMSQRMRGGGGAAGGAIQRNATLELLLKKTSYTRPAAPSKQVAEINVLKYAFIDRNTGDVVFTGKYDPTYATGPIAYNALLADAMQNPYPRFTLEYPGSGGNSPMARMRSTLDQEFAHIARDPNYGVEWLGHLVLPVLTGESQDPDQQAALNARLQASGINAVAYRAYMKWQLGHFDNMEAYNEGAKDFLPSLFRAVGENPQTGAEITAYRVFATAANREALDDWCRVAGQTELEHRIDQEVRTQGNHQQGSKILIPALYASILRGLGVPAGQLNQILASYQATGNEALLLGPLEQRYQAIFQQGLINKVVNGMSFTGATLSRQYGFPPIQSPLNTYGARRDSPIMDVFFKADYILKFMTSSPRPAESIPEHQTSQAYLGAAENRAGRSAGRTPVSGVIRYWLYPQSVQMDAMNGNSGVRFRDASVKVGVEMLESEGADRSGTDFYKSTLEEYSTHLGSLYEQYARLYPALHTLRETEKIVALARWAQKNGVHIRVIADDGPKPMLPDTADGFWGMTYIVRPSGSTDTMVTWAQGGVDFGQQNGDGWMQAGPPDHEVTNDALRSLAASTALSEKAAAAAVGGDMESARDLAEKGAEAMSGNIDFSNVPRVPMPNLPEPEPASAAAVSQASIEAVDKNVQGLQEANQTLAKAASLSATDPAQAAQLTQQGQELKSRSDQDLTRLQTMLQEYRNTPANGRQVAVDLRGLDPYKPATVAMVQPPAPITLSPTTRPAAAPPAPAPSSTPQVIEQCREEARALPTRQQLLTELDVRRVQLDNLKTVILRLNHTIQLDQKQYGEWEDEASKAVDRITERRDQMIQDATFNSFVKLMKLRLARDTRLTPEQIETQERRIKTLENLKTFEDYREWALSNKKDWEMLETGIRQLMEFLPLDENPRLSILVHGTEAVVDGAYDLVDFKATWDNLKQLDHNSAQYLEIVKRNGQKMKDTVAKIKDIETRLQATPDQPANADPCKAPANVSRAH
ncbi:MAG: PDZ domain-containing protein [Terracidiphilus sp.]|nr:PDZ domain-containing protein [Terracidiphilus sp.]MDR3776875.1 PDZ domain-containing protein [Terracidiphilus sp.]